MKILKFGINRIDLEGNKLKDQVMEIACVTNTNSQHKDRSLFVYVDGELVTTLRLTEETEEAIKSGSEINQGQFTLNTNSLAFKIAVRKDKFSEIVNYYYYTPVLPGVDFLSLISSAITFSLEVDMDLCKLKQIASTTPKLIEVVNSEQDSKYTKSTPEPTAISKYTENLTEEDLVLLISILQDLIDRRRR